MLLILGFRVSSTLLTTLFYVCERCRVQAPHQLTKQVRKLTVFFVPVLPVGTKYLDTCSSCGRVLQVTREQAEAAVGQGLSPGPQDSAPQDY